MGDVQLASDWATGTRGPRSLFIPPSDEQHLQAPGDRLTYDDLPHTPPPPAPKHKAASVTLLMQLGPRVSAVPKGENAYRQEMQSYTLTTLKTCFELIRRCATLHWHLMFMRLVWLKFFSL